jgi:hypothetical protein
LPEESPLRILPAEAPTRSLRWLWIALAILAVLVVLGGAFVVFENHAPPRAARLLPESDGLLYINLAEVRAATHFDRKPIPPDAEYEQFVQASGVQFERDVDQAAFAVHRLADPLTAQGPFAYSEVFTGHFDNARMVSYLQSTAASTETYSGHTIYAIQHDGRTVRVCVLDRHTVAISNTPQPEQIHEMLDHDKAFYFSGSTLLQDHFRDVPVFSFAWGLGRIQAPLTGDGNVHFMGLRIPLPTNTIFVASARYIDALHLRIDEFAPTEAVAATSADILRGVLAFYKGEQSLRGKLGGTPDGDMAQLLQTIQIEQKDAHASLTATVPVNLVRRVVTP